MLYQIKLGIPSDMIDFLEHLLETGTPTNAFQVISSDLERFSKAFGTLKEFINLDGVKFIRGFDEGNYVECDIPIPPELNSWLELTEPNKVFLGSHISLLKENLESALQIGEVIPFIEPLLSAIIADNFAILEHEGFCVKAVMMSGNRYADLRKFGRDILEIQTKAWVLKQGLMGKIWGASIIVGREYENKVIFLGVRDNGWGKVVLDII